MKRLNLLIVLLASLGRLSAQSSGGALSGTVTDSLTGKPLAAASVYLNNTSKGGVTDRNGAFRLTIPAGTFELVVSAIGYETVIVEIDGSRLPPVLPVRLRQAATELTAVTVEPFDKHGWARYGKYFQDNFIGIGENAASCRILNKEVLRFYFYKRGNRLRVTAAEPLQIENDALGYVLTYQLKEFVSDFNTKIIAFSGYPFFQEQTPENEAAGKNWLRKRWTAYRGSMMHFMRSLYTGHTISEGFLIQRDVYMVNEEKRRVKSIYRPDFQKPGLFPKDTLYYFWEVLREPDPIHRRLAVSPDSLITGHTARNLSIYFDGNLIVSYGVNGDADSLRQSEIRLLGAEPVAVEGNGRYYPSREILARGVWGQSEKISNLLPLDYLAVDPDSRPVLH